MAPSPLARLPPVATPVGPVSHPTRTTTRPLATRLVFRHQHTCERLCLGGQMARSSHVNPRLPLACVLSLPSAARRAIQNARRRQIGRRAHHPQDAPRGSPKLYQWLNRVRGDWPVRYPGQRLSCRVVHSEKSPYRGHVRQMTYGPQTRPNDALHMFAVSGLSLTFGEAPGGGRYDSE